MKTQAVETTRGVEDRKATFRTSEVESHRHERFFAEGRIEAGTYITSEAGSPSSPIHRHLFVLREPLEPGESRTVTTSGPEGGPGHQHEITVHAARRRGAGAARAGGQVVEVKPGRAARETKGS
jgi:hypothetical protein